MEMLLEKIGLILVSGVIAFFIGIFSSWAKKGSKTCDSHQDFLLSISKMSMEINRLLETGNKLFEKIDKLTERQIQHEQRIMLLEQLEKQRKNN